MTDRNHSHIREYSQDNFAEYQRDKETQIERICKDIPKSWGALGLAKARASLNTVLDHMAKDRAMINGLASGRIDTVFVVVPGFGTIPIGTRSAQ